jgi:hypothetical protein
VLKRLGDHLARVRWWERAIAALYLAFTVQEVMQGDVLNALVAVAISALFLVTPVFVFKGVAPGGAGWGCGTWLLAGAVFLRLG